MAYTDNAAIKAIGTTIATETQIGGNTAGRVGGVIEDIADGFDAKDANVGYFAATINGGSITVNAPKYKLIIGGIIRLKMPSVATTASTLQVGSATAKELWYNGAVTSASNTWEADEIISVFYDGARYMSSNSQGGGGKAEKISYANPLNGNTLDNVQRALDEVRGENYDLLDALGMSNATTAIFVTAPKNVVTEYSYAIHKGDRFRVKTVKNTGTTNYSVSTRNGSTTIERVLYNVNTNKDIIFQALGDANKFAVYTAGGTLGLTINIITEDINIDNVPTSGSAKLVKSGGVYDNTPSNLNGRLDSDLDIVDETYNVLARFADGNIRTKNFDSSEVTLKVKNNNDFDFTIEDENWNAIAIFQNGHIRTKKFNSEAFSAANYLQSKFQGKKIAIVGDSISTYQGWLPSDVAGFSGTSYATYYPHGDVNSVDKTWWYQVASNLGIPTTSIANTAWSGSTVCGNSTSTTNGVAACSTKRINDISIRGFTPDIIIIYIGCNDWYHCGLTGYNITLGTWAITDAVPAEGTITAFRSAYALMLAKIQNAYPNARIFCCTILDDWRRDETADDPSDNAWPSNDGAGYTTKQWNDNIKEIADAFACDVIDLHNCGITYFNIPNYAVDGGLHPNAAGHALMARKVTSELMAKY